METKKKTLFIAFSSQKGGVGKSTFTTLIASALHYRLGYHVAVFDADFPQYSLLKMRERDLAIVMENETLKKMAYKQFNTINKKAYPIIQHRTEGLLEAAQEFIETSKVSYDVVFLDLPGTVNSPGILNTLAGMDHIFTPISADRFVMESTLIFTQIMQEVIMKKGKTNLKTINLFWNQVDGRETTPLYEIYSNIIEELGLSLMQSRVKNSSRLKKETELTTKIVFRSTLLSSDERMLKSIRLDLFLEEFLRIIKI